MSTVIPHPSGWRALTVADLVADGTDAIVGGPFGSSLTSADYVPDGVPVIRGSNLAREECRFVDEDFVYVSLDKAEELRRNTAVPGDVIFTQRGTLGQVAIIPTGARFPTYIVSQSQMRVRVDEGRVVPRFLYWFYRSPSARRYLESRTLATGVPHINLGILREFPVVLPGLSEQRRIASILDEADALRLKRREALGLLDDLLRSAFLEMFGDPVTNPRGWECRSFSEVFETQLGKMLDGKKNLGEPFPYLGNRNVQWDRCDVSDLQEMRFTVDDRNRFALRPGDLLVCEGGEVGRTAIWRGEVRDCYYQKAVHRLRPRGGVTPEYALHYMKHAVGGGVFRHLTTATSIAHLTKEKLEGAAFLLPPFGLQADFSDICARVSEERDRSSTAERGAVELFESLLHRAFSGDL